MGDGIFGAAGSDGKNRCTAFFGPAVSRARYYHPDTGRFWTADTFEGQQTDPLSLHKYLYAANNPFNRVDPSGNESLIELNISSVMSAGMQGFRAAGLAVAKRMALNSIYGATLGAAVGAWDAIIDGEDPYEGMANGAIGGAAFGAAGSVPGLGPAVGLAGGVLTIESVFKAIESKKYGLAAYRATVGGLLSYSAFIKGGKPIWELPPTQRGIAAQTKLAASEYSSWYEVGAEDNGFFEAVDFQKGNNLVSLRTVDTRGKLSWKARVRGYVRELAANRSATVNGKSANLILDLRVPPGQEAEASFLIDYGKQNGITVVVKSVQ